MKAVFISCFDYYDIRIKENIHFFQQHGVNTTYLVSDYNHYKKSTVHVNYPNTIQLHVPAYKKNLSLARLWSHWIFSYKVYQQVKRINPDIIYCQFPPNSLVMRMVKHKKRTNTMLIFDLFDTWPESFPYGKYKKLLALPFKLWANLRDRYINSADLIISASEEAINVLNAIAPQVKKSVILPAILCDQLPEYQPNIEDSVRFCYLGSINHITDIDLAVNVLAPVAKVKKVMVHIIGGGQRLELFIDKLQAIGVKVICHGVIFDMIEKNKVFSLCNLGLNIPREEISSAIALKAVEYLRAGLPFLNSGIGDIRNMVIMRGVGIDINRGAPKETARTILALADDQLQLMHEQCISTYNELFSTPDMDEIYRSIFI